jgi:hypothetical protein
MHGDWKVITEAAVFSTVRILKMAASTIIVTVVKCVDIYCTLCDTFVRISFGAKIKKSTKLANLCLIIVNNIHWEQA